MDINSISFGDNGIRDVGEKKTPKVSTVDKSGIVDSVNISNASNSVDKLVDASAYKADVEFLPRIELLNTISGRLANGDYNSPDVMSAVAETLIDSSVISAEASTVNVDNSAKSSQQSGSIVNVKNQISSGYYDNPAVLDIIAKNLIDAIGLDDIFFSGK